MSRYVRRPAIENVVRRAWRSKRDPVTWVASVLYGAVADARSTLWSLGLSVPAPSRVPVVSVGGLTTGGSGKTPVTAALARHLTDEGYRVAVLTPGQADELEVHSRQNPTVSVAGGRDRARLAHRAAEDGADVVLLDSGFQHRSLARDLDVVTMLVDNAVPLRRLPAGPARERWAALDRADAVVLVRRHAPRAVAQRLESAISEAFPHVYVAHVSISARGLEPVSPAGHSVADPSPGLAVAGVMWPDLFFADVRRAGLSPRHELSLPDHGTPDQRAVALMVDLAGSGGIVCTPKDVSRLMSVLPADIPIWQIPEAVAWEKGSGRLLGGISRLVKQEAHGSNAAA